jgi:hypothetical protein
LRRYWRNHDELSTSPWISEYCPGAPHRGFFLHTWPAGAAEFITGREL